MMLRNKKKWTKSITDDVPEQSQTEPNQLLMMLRNNNWCCSGRNQTEPNQLQMMLRNTNKRNQIDSWWCSGTETNWTKSITDDVPNKKTEPNRLQMMFRKKSNWPKSITDDAPEHQQTEPNWFLMMLRNKTNSTKSITDDVPNKTNW
jgi:hypothetical protein